MNKQRVSLVIDDSAPVRSAVADSLRAAGHRVLEAATSEEALAIVASENISLSVCDLNLDERTSGLTLLNQAVRLRPGLKGILMSGSLLPGQKLHTTFSVLSKPFAPQTLIDLAERLLAEQD
jgi:DNA-binding NtrC family response regulator